MEAFNIITSCSGCTTIVIIVFRVTHVYVHRIYFTTSKITSWIMQYETYRPMSPYAVFELNRNLAEVTVIAMKASVT